MHDDNGNRLPIIVENTENRELPIGYNIYKNDLFLDFVLYPNTQYIDSDISPGTEYCYDLTAIYDEYQSYHTDIECLTTEGQPAELGDLNYDGNIDILDIISLVNMILNISPADLTAGDMNNDGILNVLDIITIVNIILDV